MSIGNLFEGAVAPFDWERFETLPQHRRLVVERVISSASVFPVSGAPTLRGMRQKVCFGTLSICISASAASSSPLTPPGPTP